VIYGSFQTENNNLSLKKVVMYYDLESGDWTLFQQYFCYIW
jgi:hypothetical protein